jgi:plasmid stabilization system protein ParE
MYILEYTLQAREDMQNLSDVIAYTYSAPMTAQRYLQGLKDKIQCITKNPESYPIRFNLSLLQYGINVRRVNYKKMAIIFSINNKTVLIHRIIASSLITVP